MKLRSSSLVVLGLLAVHGSSSCSHAPPPKPDATPPLCALSLPPDARGAAPLRTQHWIALVVQSDVGSEGYVAARTCDGQLIAPPSAPENCVVQPAFLGDLRPAPLTEDSVMVRELDEQHKVVWVATHRYPNGDAFGPVAVVRKELDTLVVESLGLMRLRSTRVELHVWSVNGGKVLVAQAERCHDAAVQSSCARASNLLVERGQQLLNVPITSRSGQCIDQAWVESHMEADQDLDTGWDRHFEINTTLSYDQRYIVITEQVEVTDSDPKLPQLAPRKVREVNTERFVHLEEARLVSEQQPLWPRILPSKGQLKLTREGL